MFPIGIVQAETHLCSHSSRIISMFYTFPMSVWVSLSKLSAFFHPWPHPAWMFRPLLQALEALLLNLEMCRRDRARYFEQCLECRQLIRDSGTTDGMVGWFDGLVGGFDGDEIKSKDTLSNYLYDI